MIRIISLFLLLALPSCKQREETPPETPANQSMRRMETQKEDLAKFVADFDETMRSKYHALGIGPEIIDSKIFRIEGTKYFNYNFRITLHRQDQLDTLKEEFYRLMTDHGVETPSA